MKNLIFFLSALVVGVLILSTSPVHSMAQQASGRAVSGVQGGVVKWSHVATDYDNVRGLKVEISESTRDYAVVFSALSPYPSKAAAMTQPVIPSHCLVRHSGLGFVTDYPATRVNNSWVVVVPKSMVTLLPGQTLHYGVWAAGANITDTNAASMWRRQDI